MNEPRRKQRGIKPLAKLMEFRKRSIVAAHLLTGLRR